MGPAVTADKAPAAPSLHQGTVVAFAVFTAVLVLLSAFFTDHNGDMDELTFYNPPYMLAHFGHLTYPGYAHRTYYDVPVITHPPIHLGLVGVLARAGFSYYYSEATPTALLFLLAIVSIVRGAFPAPVKIGLLFSIAFLMLTGETFAVFFGTRPEGHLHAAWLTGLLLLESGRLENWNGKKLFGGAFLLTWASGVHYYAGFAFLGVAVYIVWMARSLGWQRARGPIIAMCAGGCLFGIPYLTLYVVPYAKWIWTAIQANTGQQGVAGSIAAHFQIYRTWAQANWVPRDLRTILTFGIPLTVCSTAVLLIIRSTRGLALAALPLQLFVLFLAFHKLPQYLVHEIALFIAAMAAGALMLGDWLLRIAKLGGWQRGFLPVATLALALYLVHLNPTLEGAIVSTKPHVHEADLARAAAREIVGPNARIAGRLGAWYSSGADYWWDIESDILGPWPYDAATYFSNFDAVVDYAHMSDSTNGMTISSSFADGSLKLRGFFFGETNEQLQIMLLSTRQPEKVVGYAALNHQLYRFDQYPEGDYRVISAACPEAPALEYSHWRRRWREAFSGMLLLPKAKPDSPSVVITVLAPRTLAEPFGWIKTSCREMVSLNGTLSFVDADALVDSLRRTDSPMHFPRALEQMPGYTGVGLPNAMQPPADGVRLNQALSLDQLQRSSDKVQVERSPILQLSTDLAQGAFMASIPLKPGTSSLNRCWIWLRLKVVSGRICFAALDGRSKILARTQAAVLKSSEAEDAVLEMPNLKDAKSIVVFNEGDVPGKVEILDARILVAPQDWEQNKAVYAPLR